MNKKYLLGFVLLIGAALLLTSCNSEKPAQQVTVRGDQCKYLTMGFRKQLRRTMKKEKDDYLVVDYDKLCPKNDYLKKNDQNGVRYYIKVYKSPKLIKGCIEGNANMLLRGKYAKEYFTIQEKYAKGGNRDRAIKDMLKLMIKARHETNNQSWVKRILGEGVITGVLNDAANLVLMTCLPYDNVWGKYILYPVYMFGFWAVSITGNSTSGLFLVALAFVWLMALVTALGMRNIKRGKMDIAIRYDMVYTLLSLLTLFFLLIIGFFVTKPCYENVVVLKDIYGGSFDISKAYKNAVFVPSSFWLMIATVVVCLTSTLIGGAIDYRSASSEKLRKEAQDESAESIGKQLSGALFVLLACAFLDRNIVIAVLIFFSIHLLRNLIIYVKPVGQWCVRNSVGFLLIVTVICGILFFVLY